MRTVDREKYLSIVKEKGLSTALTELHAEMEAIEMEAFEGPRGYNAELVEDLKGFRDFSRELWDIDSQPRRP